jgi:glycogen synthase
MKIFFDYQIFLLQKYGGVSTYYFNLANQLIKKNHRPKIISPLYVSLLDKDIVKNNIIVGKRINQIMFGQKILTLVTK